MFVIKYLKYSMEQEAKEHLNNIRMVKPEKAERLQQIILQNAQRGTFQGKVSEAQMIDLLEQASGAGGSGMEVERSRHRFDEDDDLDIDNLDI